MERLAGVLLEVHAGDADAPSDAAGGVLDARRRSRAAGRTARSDSPSAGPDRSSSCARRSTSAAPCSRARAPRASANSTARRLSTGSAPGRPRQTGQTLVFGGAPNAVLHPQKIFVSVSSWAWISRPMTGFERSSCRDASRRQPCGPGRLHVRRRRRLERLEVVDEHPRELAACASYAAPSLPRVARLEDLARHARAARRHVELKIGSRS